MPSTTVALNYVCPQLTNRCLGIMTLAWAPDSKSVVSGCSDGTIKKWSANLSSCRSGVAFADGSPVVKVAISKDGEVIIAFSYSFRMVMFDSETLDGLDPDVEPPYIREEGIGDSRLLNVAGVPLFVISDR